MNTEPVQTTPESPDRGGDRGPRGVKGPYHGVKKAANLPNRYSRRAEGLWRMRRHGLVTAQCTNSVVFPKRLHWWWKALNFGWKNGSYQKGKGQEIW